MNTLIVVFILSFSISIAEGHSSRRYKAQAGQYYDADTLGWNRIHDVSSPAECGHLCTLWDSHNVKCPLFQTLKAVYLGQTGEDFRGYKCYLWLDDLE